MTLDSIPFVAGISGLVDSVVNTAVGDVSIETSYVESSGKTENLTNDISDRMGEDARCNKNSSDDTIIISQDGTRRVRFDLNKTFPH